jgi:uncharacterized membrane protein/osmotically-inducible protein OsmY
MNNGATLMSGIGLGGGLMFLLDPVAGRRRRARIRDKVISTAGSIGDYLDATGRDLSHRSQGLMAQVRQRFAHHTVSDEVLVEQVRSKLGRFVSHPHAIMVAATNGQVALSGPILQREVNDLLACISAIPGVTDVDNRLEVHKHAGDVAALQGGRGRPGEQLEFLQSNWSPATRLLVGSAGCGLMANCLARRTPLATVLGTVGFGLFLRALTNRELRPLLGIRGGRFAFDVHKTITVAAPVERVFQLWTLYDNFPRFMCHLRQVRNLGGGRSHRVANGPAGMPVAWNAILTRLVPNESLAWKSEPGSTIANAGIIRFESLAGEATRVDIRLSYTPPAGALGQFAAKLFGADAKSAIDEDLVRFKSLIEEGKTSAPGKRVTCEEVVGAAL